MGLTLDYLSFDGRRMVWLGGIEHREMQGEDGALGELAGYAHATAHRFHHAFYQIKTEAYASDLAITHAFGAIEGFKNVRKVRGRDSDSLVLYADLHFRRSLIQHAARPQSHPAVLARVFHGIANQVFHAFAQRFRISDDKGQLWTDLFVKHETFIAQHRFGRRQALLQNGNDFGWPQIVSQAAHPPRRE